ncbi:MAG: RluA family pseudouridine synthase [Thermoguttaceae bacterium]|nr:RluA family pseudouridine synthase [Thermoguttaceae bacterium]
MSLGDIPILFENVEILVINKPAGILTQAPAGVDSLEIRIRQYLAAQQPPEPSATVPKQRREVYLGMPHRLDRPATGVLIFGKTRRATRRLARQFERRLIRKTYWACVQGWVRPEEGTWHDLVRKIPDQPQAEIATAEQPDAQLAVLRYRVLRYFPWGTWMEIELETGRYHQIRIQAASRGHPVLGDIQYGSQIPFGPQYDDWRLRPIALHARSLEFIEPISQAPMRIIAPLWPPWAEIGIVDENTPPRSLPEQ